VLIEPIQNFAGYRIPAEGLLCALREICDEFGMLLIVDEVFTGFGRAGAWLASDVEDCRPDIVCVGKGMLGGIGGGACVAPKELMEKLSGAGMVQLHGSTFKANPIACTAIATTVAVMERDKLIVRSARLGEIALSQLERLHDLPIVAEVRGRGLVIGIELCSPSDSTSARDLAQRACAAAETHGINIICNGYPDGNVVAISPPLVIKEDDFLGALNIVVSVLEGLANGC
jgi:4-aminobutyrate aminotransferase/(S)-3-amino-2-methylpropionate transaminase